MYRDAPECFRCCFCFPLRYGLCVWGYFKLVVSLLFLGFLDYELVRILRLDYYSTSGIVVLSILISVLSVDTIFDILLIRAAHQKHLKLFQWYYYYSMVVLTLFVAVLLLNVGFQIGYIFKENMTYFFIMVGFMRENLFFCLAVILIQIYITLLVRTEMLKLRDNCKFEFVNNQAEAQCTVNVETA